MLFVEKVIGESIFVLVHGTRRLLHRVALLGLVDETLGSVLLARWKVLILHLAEQRRQVVSLRLKN